MAKRVFSLSSKIYDEVTEPIAVFNKDTDMPVYLSNPTLGDNIKKFALGVAFPIVAIVDVLSAPVIAIANAVEKNKNKNKVQQPEMGE